MRRLLILALSLLASGTAIAQQNSPASMLYDKQSTSGNLSVLDKSNSLVGVCNVNSSTHTCAPTASFPVQITVANHTELSALSTASYTYVQLMGYTNPGDAQSLVYKGQNTCPYNSGSADQGACFASSDSHFWVAQFTTNVFDPRNWGAKGDGSTDDTSAIQNALNACSVAGGGNVFIADLKYVVSSANISVPSFCYLKGNASQGALSAVASTPNDYRTLPYQIKLSTSYTIQFHRNSGIDGVNVIASNWVPSNTLQGIATMIQNFAGVALTLGPEGSAANNNGNDITVRNVFILGFAQCIDAEWADRERGENVFGDCTSGLKVNQSHDVSRWNNVHFWSFASQNQNIAVNYAHAAVSGVTNSGGVFEITTSGAHGFASGNTIILNGLAGYATRTAPGTIATNPNGVWTVSVIDTTHFTLTGSTYAAGYTSGGTATLDNTFRNGKGYEIYSSEAVDCVNCFDWGHQYSIYFGTGATWGQFSNANVDGYFNLSDGYANWTNAGVWFDSGSDRNTVSTGVLSAHAFPVYNSAGSGSKQNNIVATSIGSTNYFSAVVASGSLSITGGDLTGGSQIYIADLADALVMNGVQNNGTIINYQSIADCGKVLTNGVPGCGTPPVYVKQITEWGADPTGAVDSTAAFNAAKAANPNGGTVHMPCGKYLITSFTNDVYGLTFEGEAPAAGGTPCVRIATTQTSGPVWTITAAYANLYNVTMWPTVRNLFPQIVTSGTGAYWVGLRDVMAIYGGGIEYIDGANGGWMQRVQLRNTLFTYGLYMKGTASAQALALAINDTVFDQTWPVYEPNGRFTTWATTTTMAPGAVVDQNGILWQNGSPDTIATTVSSSHDITVTCIARSDCLSAILVGQKVTGTGIPVSTTVSSILGNVVTLNNAATASGTGVAITFSCVTSGSGTGPSGYPTGTTPESVFSNFVTDGTCPWYWEAQDSLIMLWNDSYGRSLFVTDSAFLNGAYGYKSTDNAKDGGSWPEFNRFSNVSFDSSLYYSVWLSAGSDFRFVNSFMSSTGFGTNFAISPWTGSGGATDFRGDLTVMGSQIINACADGVYISSPTKNLHFSDNSINTNGVCGTPGTWNNIDVEAAVTNSTFTNNSVGISTFAAGLSATAGYGILLGAHASDYLTITGNICGASGVTVACYQDNTSPGGTHIYAPAGANP